jgi:molybdopterin molybdotransferase
MKPFNEALNIILDSVSPLDGEKADILDSAGRIIYTDIVSDTEIPPFNNSAMDGYAVRSGDLKNASQETPVRLKIRGEVQAGINTEKLKVGSGQAVRIMTGAPMPLEADAVIPVEDTSEESETLLAYKELKKDENVRFAGEDITSGQRVLKRGDLLKSADIGLLASLNYREVDVFRRPKVAVISTGNEIVDVGEVIKPGQIRNSNAYTLQSEIKKYRGIPHYLGIAKDTKEETKSLFQKGFQNDILITTGGVSMGKYDYVKDVMKDLGVDIKIEKVKMKPGKPMVFGTLGKKLFFGLPGNPVSTLISFNEFVRPAMLKAMGASKLEKPYISAVAENDIRKKAGRRNFIRGYFTLIQGVFHVSTTGPQGSGILRSMSEANCIIILPSDVELVKKGESVIIELLRHEEI